MKNERLLKALGDIDDTYIKEAAPQPENANRQVFWQVFMSKRMLRFAVIPLVCIVVFLLGTTAFAANYIQSNLSDFYLRYLSPQEMAVADSMAEQYGAKIYFDGLKSGDMYQQYFSINKLVEYYNDETVRQNAVQAITPFLTSEEEKLANAAAFALSVLNETFDDPYIIHLADNTVIFTLFNDYADYGSYSKVWMIQEGKLKELLSFDGPQMYVTNIIPSPDKKLFAVTLCSNKSEYLMMYDWVNGMTSPELVDSARVMVAKDLDYTFWQRMDYQNYSSAWDIRWIDNATIAFKATLSYNGSEFLEDADVTYDCQQKQMNYTLLEE